LAKRLGVVIFVGVLLLAFCVYALLAASLPRRTGAASVPGLASTVSIDLDARAVPTIRAASFEDALRGQGYMHAQERFFEMDLLRRLPAAELAALLGERAVASDLVQAPFEFRTRARAVLATLPAEQIAWLDAYTAGVNAGLADLRTRPPEYWLLRSAPQVWRSEDSVLVVLAFYTMLSNNDTFERSQGVLHDTVPPEVYEFLTPSTSRFDRPLVTGDPADPTGGYEPLPIPAAETLDLRQSREPPVGPRLRVDPPLAGPASNQWAVDATRGAGGHALLANDPHLGLRLPSLFYRSELEWPGSIVRGVSVPGLPGILLGANGALAWGATVSNADQADWVVIEVSPSDANSYLTPEGSEPFATHMVDVHVAGHAEPKRISVQTTRWGPVVAHDWRGRPLALHATWLAPASLNLSLLALAKATSVTEGIATLAHWAGPSLNWMLADKAGEIGWIVNGPLPRRTGFDGSYPVSWADGERAWDGEIEDPTLVGGHAGALFTANNRTLPPARADAISRMWMRPLRAQRIDELLRAQLTFTPRDFLTMQLDTRAFGYEQLRAAVLDAVRADDPDPLLAKGRALLAQWSGRADVDQPAVRLLQAFYRALLDRALSPLLAPAIAADPTYVYRWPLADEALRRLLDERPPHLLTSEHADWPAFQREVFLATLRSIEAKETEPGIDASWGDVNVLDVAHPFAALLPSALRRWLELPPAPLPGSMVSLRVAAPGYGAVIRMAVSPAAPEEGILEMAGGQSGHFLSPQFRDQQQDWVVGAPAPFVAGPAVSHIALAPPAQAVK
jgi:penicillin G amidase